VVVFLGAFAKLRKVTINFVMSVVLPVRLKKLRSHSTDYHEILYLSIFRKRVGEIPFSLKYDNDKGTLHEDLRTFMVISRSVLKCEMFQT
jgi:hypothetical protein